MTKYYTFLINFHLKSFALFQRGKPTRRVSQIFRLKKIRLRNGNIPKPRQKLNSERKMRDGYLNNNKLHRAVHFGNTLKWVLYWSISTIIYSPIFPSYRSWEATFFLLENFASLALTLSSFWLSCDLILIYKFSIDTWDLERSEYIQQWKTSFGCRRDCAFFPARLRQPSCWGDDSCDSGSLEVRKRLKWQNPSEMFCTKLPHTPLSLWDFHV